jgi:dinuclear metal center YbgI/SA1388 family protein
MLCVDHILDVLFRWAPKSLAWEKDNIGLLVGTPAQRVDRILVCLDVTEAVVDEAIDRNANLIVAHHPLIFHPLKSLRLDTAQGRSIEKLLRNGISVIAMHTNADAASAGLNRALAERLGLRNLRPLDAARSQLKRLECMISTTGIERTRIETMLPDLRVQSHFMREVGQDSLLLTLDATRADMPETLSALRLHLGEALLSHRCWALEDPLTDSGMGMLGELATELTAESFLHTVKELLACAMLRVTPYEENMSISRVAVCGGAGASLLRTAVSAGAQCMVTGDLTHHLFLDHAHEILLVDAGHFETENIFVEICSGLLANAPFQDSQKIDILKVRTNTNPVRFV